MTTSRQEAQWVLRAQCGDREALECLLRSVQPLLDRYLRSLAGTFHADDVLQEVLILLCRNLGCLRTPELFRPWAYRIASRAAFRHLKKERHRPCHDAVPLDELPAPPPRLPEDTVETLLAAEDLPPPSRAVLALHYQQQLSLPEVAAILQIPLGTVKSRLAAGLTALRNHVSKRSV